jgi:C4-dicarboxylate-specific signal transduction histidine kinase
MTRKNWLHAPVIAGLLAAVTYLFVHGTSLNPVQHESTLQNIISLQRVNAELGRDLLLARSGILRHYDSLNRAVTELHGHVKNLRSRQTATALPPEVMQRIDAVAANIVQKENLVERFKSSNALLLNSWAYFIHRSREISQWNKVEGEPVEQATEMRQLALIMMQILRHPQGDVNDAAAALLDRLEQMDSPEHLKASIESMVTHGRLILNLAPKWDSDLRTLLVTPTVALIDSLRDRYLEHRKGAEDRAGLYRKLLYIVSVLLLVHLIYLISRLQTGKQALAGLNAELLEEIKERKQAEEASRKHQSQLAHTHRLSVMGEMASGLAHELNQPLTAINFYTKGCMRRLQQANGKQAELLDAMAKVSAEARRAGEIISWMRGFIQKAETRKTVVDVNSAIQEAIDLLGHELQSQGINTNFDLAISLPPALADKIQIQQIVLNLVRNSMESMNDNGHTRRDLTIRTSKPTDDTIEVSIQDSGHGVPAEVLENIFDSFFTTRTDGLGLGLSICRSLVEVHGGQLWVTASAGTGATFHFTMPATTEVSDGPT